MSLRAQGVVYSDASKASREIGVRMLKATNGLDRAVVPPNTPPSRLAMLVLVARARRLLLSAYELADGGYRLEATLPLRGILEAAFTVGWMAKDPELAFLIWSLDELKSGLSQHREVQRNNRNQRRRMRRAGQTPPALRDGQPLGLMDVGTVRRYKRELKDLVTRLDSIPDRKRRFRRLGQTRRTKAGDERFITDMPSFKKRAQVGGMNDMYGLIYRFDSRVAVHPNPLSVEQLLERSERGIVINSAATRNLPDPYAAGAALFSLVLERASAAMPELALDGALYQFINELGALRPFYGRDTSATA
jgi:Family of unknown function (DUF5677)